MSEVKPVHAVVRETAPRDVPVDWEALEDAFENNAPEVHSYLQLSTGEVLRVVDGVADPQMHVRIASDANYLRVDPVSSREQYRWMERFIPLVEEPELKAKLGAAIDGKGAFRRFKDVLMTYNADRERWFAFRSERLKTFMEAWLNAHSIRSIPRPQWVEPEPITEPMASTEEVAEAVPASDGPESGIPSSGSPDSAKASGKRTRTTEANRHHLKELVEGLGPREIDMIVAFAEFLKSRRAARGFAYHQEHLLQERFEAGALAAAGAGAPAAGDDED